MRQSPLNPRYTLESFVPGESNRLARVVVESILEKAGAQYNPCVIYGGVGLGKTHLLHAIGNAMSSLQKTRVFYTTSEQFTKDYAVAVERNGLTAFRAYYRSLDCLLFDDVQFLTRKDRPEQEFLRTFIDLEKSCKQIVVGSDRSPKEMAGLDPLLMSRLKRGFAVEIEKPDLETRIAILRKKAGLEGFSVSDDVILFMASSIKADSVNALEGGLIRLKAFQVMTPDRAVSVRDARDICRDQMI